MLTIHTSNSLRCNLAALIHRQTFQDNLKPGLFPKFAPSQDGEHSTTPPASRKRRSPPCPRTISSFFTGFTAPYRPDGKTIPPITPPHPPRQQRASCLDLPYPNSGARSSAGRTAHRRRTATAKRQQLETLKLEIAALKQQSEAVLTLHDTTGHPPLPN